MSSVLPPTVRHGAGCACRACDVHELTAGYELDEPGRADPTGTTTIQREFARWVRGQIGSLDSDIRELIHDENALGLADDTASRWAGLSDTDRVRRFEDWLDSRIDGIVDGEFEQRAEEYLEEAARRGAEDAHRDLREHGVDIGDASETLAQDDVQEEIAIVAEETRARVRRDLENFRAEAATLATAGMTAGVARSQLARDIVERGQVAKSEVTEDIAAEVVNQYNTTEISSYERVPEEVEVELTTEVEFQTAGDDRVCAVCEELSQRDWSLEEARSENPIPVHPYCRCRFSVSDVREVDV